MSIYNPSKSVTKGVAKFIGNVKSHCLTFFTSDSAISSMIFLFSEIFVAADERGENPLIWPVTATADWTACIAAVWAAAAAANNDPS